LFHLGELTQARVNLEQGIALYDPQQHLSAAFQYGQDTGMAGRSYVALVLWHLGYPDQALQQCREALLLAEEPVHPFSLAYALGLATRLHQIRGEAQMVRERTERAFTLATQQGVPFFSAWGMCFQGWAVVEQGQGEQGMRQFHQGLATYQATGTGLWWPSL